MFQVRDGDKVVDKVGGVQVDKVVHSHGVARVDRVVAAVGEVEVIERYLKMLCSSVPFCSLISCDFL